MDSLGGFDGTIAVVHEPCDSVGPVEKLRRQEPDSPRGGGEPWPAAERFLGLSNTELGRVDPVVMNLAVAKGIPSLADLDIGRYVRLADQWAAEIGGYLPACEANFYRHLERFQNDLDFSHLAVIGWYVGNVLRIDYREDQKNLKRVLYTDPSDLFLDGIMNTRRGTCGNMALLWVVLGQRLGWPVSLACVGSHFICRYDDGGKVFNIETTQVDGGEWSSPPDRFYLQECEWRIPQRAVDCGSDLRALTRREMLGAFFGARARHLENINRFNEAEPDYLVARYLFPRNRQLYISQNQVSVQNSMELFEPGEKGHPIELAHWLQEVVQVAPWLRKQPQQIIVPKPQEKRNDSRSVDAVLQAIYGGSAE